MPRPSLLALIAAATGCVHTHPVQTLERDARQLDKAWSVAVENAPDDGRYWIHRTEAVAVAADAAASFAPLVEVAADRVRSDWVYASEAGIDEAGEWHTQSRERVLTEVSGDQTVGVTLVKRSENRRLKAGLTPGGWAGGDQPWDRPETTAALRDLETQHLARPVLEGEEDRLRRVAIDAAPDEYAVVADEKGRLLLERFTTVGQTNKGGTKTASWHHRSQLELLITTGGAVDVQRRAEHRFDVDQVEGTWGPASTADELAARRWVESMLADPRSGLKLGPPLRDPPAALTREPTAPPVIPKLRTMPELQQLVASEAIRTSTGDFRVCLAGAQLPASNPAGGPWDPDPADPEAVVLPGGRSRTAEEVLGPARGADRTVPPLVDLAQVKREIPIVELASAQAALTDQAMRLEAKSKAFSTLKLPMHPDVSGRLDAGDKAPLTPVADRLAPAWEGVCVEKRFKTGLPVIHVDLQDDEEGAAPEPLAACDLDLATVLALGDAGVTCGEARLFFSATYLFDLPQIELVGLPPAGR